MSAGLGTTGIKARSDTSMAEVGAAELMAGGQSMKIESKFSMWFLTSRCILPSMGARLITDAGKGRSSGAALAQRVAVP